MNTKPQVLVVDDNPDVLMAMRLLFRGQVQKLDTLSDPNQLVSSLQKHNYDVVILDMNFVAGINTGNEGFYWLQEIKKHDESVQVIFLTAYAEIEKAVEAVHKGAYDYVEKPWDDNKLVFSVLKAFDLRKSGKELKQLKRKQRQISKDQSGFHLVWGNSPVMQEVKSLVQKVAVSDANVLVLGENGTGKELIARELHRKSARSDKVFLSVDVGSIAESLFESEMFGHRKGAFTGAAEDRPGRFQAANGGTLFLDEIGNLPLQLQAKLLNALEQRKVTPVGSDKPEEIDLRLVSATNVSVDALRDESRFRPDLLFRLNTVEITLPPLRERRDDILPIARHYLAMYSRKYANAPRSFSAQAEEAMQAYDWPGNVRALRHAVERSVILASNDVIEPGDLQLNYGTPRAQTETVPVKPVILKLDDMERTAIQAALRKHGFNISHAAKELGLTRASLYRRMEKHGL